MNTIKNVLLTIGGISFALFLILLILGLKVVSVVFLYILGAIVVISVIGLGIYYLGKISGKKEQ